MPRYPHTKQATYCKEAPHYTGNATHGHKKRAKCPICVPEIGRQIGHLSAGGARHTFFYTTPHVRRGSPRPRSDSRGACAERGGSWGSVGGIGACADGSRKNTQIGQGHPNRSLVGVSLALGD